MKTYLQINESKSTLKASPESHTHTYTHIHTTHTLTRTYTPVYPHTHTPSYTVFFHAIHNTEGILRGLCNKEHTKQFKYGCGMNGSTHMHNNEHTHKHAHSLLRFVNG